MPDLDPQMKLILERMLAQQVAGRSAWKIDVEDLRANARDEYRYWNAQPLPVHRVDELVATGAFGDSRVRLYDPLGVAYTKPGLIYFHGGGWVIGDLDLEDAALRYLARASGIAIFSVDYVLAPEHRFPEPLQDCVQVCHWIRRNAGHFAVDAERLALGGASAGANLALSAALALRDSGQDWVRYLLLKYGVYSTDFESPSYQTYGDGRYVLSRAAMEYFFNTYLVDSSQRSDVRAVPMLAELSRLPPVALIAAEFDPLLDDSLRLAERLGAAGVPVTCDVYPGVIHGFTLLHRELDAAVHALERAGKMLCEGPLTQR